MSIKLDGMSPKELKELISKAQQQMSVVAEAHAKETLEKLTAIAKEAGYDIYDLVGVRAKRRASAGSKAPVKFRHPKNPQLTWAGRGKRPTWLNEFLASGGKLEDAQA
jgi:DNA-binding protein H-NS